MYLRTVFDQLIRYFDAEKNYYNEPVLREELSIIYKGKYDSMLTDISKATDEERQDAIDYLDGVLEECRKQEKVADDNFDTYRVREDLAKKFQTELLEIRGKISEIERYKKVINEYLNKKGERK